MTHAGLQSRFTTNNSHHYPPAIYNIDIPNIGDAPSTVNQSSTPAPSDRSRRLTSEIAKISPPSVARVISTPSSQESGNKTKTPLTVASTPPVSSQMKTIMSIDDKFAPRPDPNSASKSGLEAHSSSEGSAVKPLIRHASAVKVQNNEPVLSPEYQEGVQETFNRPVMSYASAAKRAAKRPTPVAPSPSHPNAHRSSDFTLMSQKSGPSGYINNSGQGLGTNNSTPSGSVTHSPFLNSQPSASSGRVPSKLGAQGNEVMYVSNGSDGDVSLWLF